MSNNIGDLTVRILLETGQTNKESVKVTKSLQDIERQGDKTTAAVKKTSSELKEVGEVAARSSTRTRELRQNVISLSYGFSDLSRNLSGATSGVESWVGVLGAAISSGSIMVGTLVAIAGAIATIKKYTGVGLFDPGGLSIENLAGYGMQLDMEQSIKDRYISDIEQGKIQSYADKTIQKVQDELQRVKETIPYGPGNERGKELFEIYGKKDKGLGSQKSGSKIEKVKSEIELLEEEYNKLIDTFEKPFKMASLTKAIELMQALGKPINEILRVENIQAAKLTEGEYKRLPIGEVPGEKKKDPLLTRADEYQTKMSQSLSFAQQISSVLGIGADSFVGKFLGGLQEGLSLANSFAQLLSLVAGIGSGGIFGLLGFASGGSVPGSGSGDTVPAMLTPGEYVIRKSAVQRFGTGFMEWINGGGLFNSLAGHYANGGMVTGTGAGGVQVVVLESRVKGSDIILSQARESKKTNRRII